jgi:hypothetical protein
VSLELSGIICSSCDVAPKRWSIRAEGRSLRRTGVLPGDMFERHVVVVPDDGRSEVSPGRLLPRVIGRRPDPFTTRDGGVHDTSSTTTFISITYQPPLSSSPTPLPPRISHTTLLPTTPFSSSPTNHHSYHPHPLYPSLISYTTLLPTTPFLHYLPTTTLIIPDPSIRHSSLTQHYFILHHFNPTLTSIIITPFISSIPKLPFLPNSPYFSIFFLFLNTHFHLLRTLYPSQYYTSLVSTSYPYQPFSEHTHYSFTFSPPLFNSSNP